MFADIESYFGCSIIAWGEWNGECDQYIAADSSGRVIVADSAELLVLELAQARTVVSVQREAA